MKLAVFVIREKRGRLSTFDSFQEAEQRCESNLCFPIYSKTIKPGALLKCPQFLVLKYFLAICALLIYFSHSSSNSLQFSFTG